MSRGGGSTSKRTKTKPPSWADGHNLLVRKDDVLCTICGQVLPVNPGNGTPLPSLLYAYYGAKAQHPDKPHERPFGT